MTAPRVPGEAREIQLEQGMIRYREAGEGAPLVFVHGLLVNGGLWRKVVEPLSANYRCIVPDLPLGAHGLAMEPGADLTFPGLARLLSDFIKALDLEDVTLIGNDTGGAVCQFATAYHPDRIVRLVLTNCDTPGNFPPALLWPLVWGARGPGFVSLLGMLLRVRTVQRLFFGLVVKHPVEQPVTNSYLERIWTDPGTRRDLRKVLAGVLPAQMRAVSNKLPNFNGPVLLAWAPEDRMLFPIKHARRLEARLPKARLEKVPDSYAFVPEDNPGRLVDLIRVFVASRLDPESGV